MGDDRALDATHGRHRRLDQGGHDVAGRTVPLGPAAPPPSPGRSDPTRTGTGGRRSAPGRPRRRTSGRSRCPSASRILASTPDRTVRGAVRSSQRTVATCRGTQVVSVRTWSTRHRVDSPARTAAATLSAGVLTASSEKVGVDVVVLVDRNATIRRPPPGVRPAGPGAGPGHAARRARPRGPPGSAPWPPGGAARRPAAAARQVSTARRAMSTPAATVRAREPGTRGLTLEQRRPTESGRGGSGRSTRRAGRGPPRPAWRRPGARSSTTV